MALVTFSTSSVGLEPARVVFSPILNHTCSELNTMKYLGHPENDTNNFSYYSTQKPLSDDDLKTIIFAFSFRVLIIHHRDNSRRLTSQFIL